MRSFRVFAILAALLLVSSGTAEAKAYTTFDFTYISNAYDLKGVLYGTPWEGGAYEITGGHTTFEGQTFSLVRNPVFPQLALDSHNAFFYDDILYPTQPQLSSTGGLLFANRRGSELLNIWGNGEATNYAFYVWRDGRYIVQDGDWGSWKGHGTFEAHPIAEPGTIFLLGAGLAGLGIYRGRVKKPRGGRRPKA